MPVCWECAKVSLDYEDGWRGWLPYSLPKIPGILPRLTPRQHAGIGDEARKHAAPGTTEYLILRARLAALVFLGATYGVNYDGGDWQDYARTLGAMLNYSAGADAHDDTDYTVTLTVRTQGLGGCLTTEGLARVIADEVSRNAHIIVRDATVASWPGPALNVIRRVAAEAVPLAGYDGPTRGRWIIGASMGDVVDLAGGRP